MKSQDGISISPDQGEAFLVSNPVQNKNDSAPTWTQSWTQVGHVEGNFLSVAMAATLLKVSVKTVTRWCETGKLAALSKRYGKKTSYLISPQAVEMFRESRELKAKLKESLSRSSESKDRVPQGQLVKAWLKAMGTGLLTGKAFSSRTIDDYNRNLMIFFSQYDELTTETLKKALMKIDPVHFCKREHLYKACLCFSRFLVKEGAADAGLSDDLKTLAPKRHKPPKRNTVKADELQRLYDGCQSPQDRAIVALLSTTGLRASEACALNVSDIDLMEGVLTVQCGKGGKRRQVGLSPSAMAALSKQIESLPTSSKNAPVFLDLNGKRMTPSGLHARLERIGKAVGVTANPHALRRAFVTINANKGRPLQMLQRACGHSDIKTTMSYCRTSEKEVVDAMKKWD